MKADVEESPAGKHGLRRANGDKGLASKIRIAPALAGLETDVVERGEQWLPFHALCFYTPEVSTINRAGRAPPYSHLG